MIYRAHLSQHQAPIRWVLATKYTNSSFYGFTSGLSKGVSQIPPGFLSQLECFLGRNHIPSGCLPPGPQQQQDLSPPLTRPVLATADADVPITPLPPRAHFSWVKGQHSLELLPPLTARNHGGAPRASVPLSLQALLPPQTHGDSGPSSSTDSNTPFLPGCHAVCPAPHTPCTPPPPPWPPPRPAADPLPPLPLLLSPPQPSPPDLSF